MAPTFPRTLPTVTRALAVLVSTALSMCIWGMVTYFIISWTPTSISSCLIIAMRLSWQQDLFLSYHLERRFLIGFLF